MKKVTGFIISSARTLERNASSEVYYILDEVLKYKNVKASPTNSISGLSIVTFEGDPIRALKDIEKEVKAEPSSLQFTLKLVPFCYKTITSLENIEEITVIITEDINENDTWKINLRRRHTQLDRKQIIESVARLVKQGKVKLEEPDHYLIIEIVGKWTYMCLSPIAELSLNKYIEENTLKANDFEF